MSSPLPESAARRVSQVAVWGAVPALLGVGVWVAEDHGGIGPLVVWGEPLLAVLGLHVMAWLLWEGRRLHAGSLAAGLVVGGAALRAPTTPVRPPPPAADFARVLRGCAVLPEAAARPIRVLTWTVDPDAPLPAEDLLVGPKVDLAVLNGLDDPEVADRLARAIHGESMVVPGPQPVTLVVRGVFHYCGGRDAWSVPLADGQGATGQAVLTFPQLEDTGVLPFLAVRLPGPGEPQEWPEWSARLLTAGDTVGTVVRALSGHRVVLAGDFGVPQTFAAVASPLEGAGIAEVGVPPSWPASLGVHALDRVFAGSDWAPAGATTLPAAGHSRAPVVVGLRPEHTAAVDNASAP